MRKTLKAVGDPEKRFQEDKLRILRALRFHAQLGFVIDPKTAEAIRKRSGDIHQVSMERIRDEWQKLLTGDHAVTALQQVYDLGLWAPLFKTWRFQPNQYKKLFALKQRDSNKLWVLWFLAHSPSPEKIAELGLYWKLPKKRIQIIVYCSQSLTQLRKGQEIASVDLALFLAKPNGRLALEVYQQLDQGRIKEMFFEKKRAAEAFFINGELPELLVNGDDLIQYGVAPGPQIAKGLKRLYRIQLIEKVANKEELLKHLSP